MEILSKHILNRLLDITKLITRGNRKKLEGLENFLKINNLRSGDDYSVLESNHFDSMKFLQWSFF